MTATTEAKIEKPAKVVCRAVGCKKTKLLARGLCSSHYSAWRSGKMKLDGVPAHRPGPSRKVKPPARTNGTAATTSVSVSISLGGLSQRATQKLLMTVARGETLEGAVGNAVERWALAAK